MRIIESASIPTFGCCYPLYSPKSGCFWLLQALKRAKRNSQAHFSAKTCPQNLLFRVFCCAPYFSSLQLTCEEERPAASPPKKCRTLTRAGGFAACFDRVALRATVLLGSLCVRLSATALHFRWQSSPQQRSEENS